MVPAEYSKFARVNRPWAFMWKITYKLPSEASAEVFCNHLRHSLSDNAYTINGASLKVFIERPPEDRRAYAKFKEAQERLETQVTDTSQYIVCTKGKKIYNAQRIPMGEMRGGEFFWFPDVCAPMGLDLHK